MKTQSNPFQIINEYMRPAETFKQTLWFFNMLNADIIDGWSVQVSRHGKNRVARLMLTLILKITTHITLCVVQPTTLLVLTYRRVFV